MSSNPYLKDITKHEQIFAKELDKLLTKAVQAKDVQKKADKLTNSSTKTPPKPVEKVFETALAKAMKSLPKKYAGLDIRPYPSYEQKDASWIAKVAVTAWFEMTGSGGGTYKVKPRDTLWDIAKDKYGHGMYWPVIAAENPKVVKSKGNFILAGVELKIPAIDIPVGICEVPSMTKASKPTPEARKPAVSVMYPTLEFDLEKGSSIKQVMKGPGMTLIVTTTLKGSIKAQKKGPLPGSFNLRTYETELSNGLKPFQSSIKFKSFKVDSITVASNVSGTTWKSSISISKTGAIKASLSPKPVSFTKKDLVFEGNVGLEIEIQAIPDKPKVKVRVPKPIYVEVFDWVVDNGAVVVGGVLIVGAGVVVVATLVEDVLTAGAGIADDPASFAAASAMFGQGLQMVR